MLSDSNNLDGGKRTSVSDRCRIVGGDFFESVPASGDAYLLRHVLHDWDDREAISILENCRNAMRPGGRVLVVETVIPGGNDPCFGKWLDLMMLVVGGPRAHQRGIRPDFFRGGATDGPRRPHRP
jgi:hypothetical protein